MHIAGQVAVVTGAGIGTGRAIALALVAAGAEVVVSDVDEDGGRRTVADSGGRARFVPADLTDADGVQRLIDSAHPTILVNNAGGGGHIPPHFPAATAAEWGAVLDLKYGAAKAGLIRFTSALAAVDGVRVNCIVPDWVATERVTPEERATTPPPIPLDTVADAVLTLIRDDTRAGRAAVLLRGGATRID